MNCHHKVWDQLKISTTGDWYDKTKRNIQGFSEFLQIARTHTAAITLVSSDLQEVTQHSPMAEAMKSTGLSGIFNPSVGALEVNTGHADMVTAGIPPGLVVDAESWEIRMSDSDSH